MQDRHSRLENSTRARFYLNIENFQYQKYLDIFKVQKYRINRLRLSSHRLETEMGHWAKPNKVPLDNRKCKICNVVEDKFHFILECILFKDLRKCYVNKCYWERPNMPNS